MMLIRNGTYTLYDNLEMALIDNYGHGLDVDLEEHYKLLVYFDTKNLLPNFSYNPTMKWQQKQIKISALTNAFQVQTFTKINDQKFSLNSQGNPTSMLRIGTKDKSYKNKPNWFELYDGEGKPYYASEVPVDSLSVIWEERTKSKLQLPVPPDLENLVFLKGK